MALPPISLARMTQGFHQVTFFHFLTSHRQSRLRRTCEMSGRNHNMRCYRMRSIAETLRILQAKTNQEVLGVGCRFEYLFTEVWLHAAVYSGETQLVWDMYPAGRQDG